MSVVLVVILSTAAVAFFGCFFLGICRDGRRASESNFVEIVRLSEESGTDQTSARKSA